MCELERERRKELLDQAIRRHRQAPSVHVFAQMTGEERELDRVAMSASEVGYVAKVLRTLGHKLRDGGNGGIEEGGWAL